MTIVLTRELVFGIISEIILSLVRKMLPKESTLMFGNIMHLCANRYCAVIERYCDNDVLEILLDCNVDR